MLLKSFYISGTLYSISFVLNLYIVKVRQLSAKQMTWLQVFFLQFSFSFTMFKNAYVIQYTEFTIDNNYIKSFLRHLNIIWSIKTCRNAWHKIMTDCNKMNHNKNYYRLEHSPLFRQYTFQSLRHKEKGWRGITLLPGRLHNELWKLTFTSFFE